jgi:hypothetical protein
MAKKKEVRIEPRTWEEFLAVEWTSFELHHKNDHPPECNYRFRPGQEVRIGMLSECRVEDTFRDGQLVLVSYHDRGETYGKPYDNKRRLPRLVWWNSLAPIEGVEDTHFGRDRIQTQMSQTGLSMFLHALYSRGTIDSPEYQRGYVWTFPDKHRLIESIFNRTDIGKFLLMEYPDDNRLEIVDGKQRIRAIMDYVENRFHYRGKTYFQLSWQDKLRLTDVMVQTATLQADKVKKSDVLWLFLAINKGGVPQTEEHLSKAQALYEAALKDEREKSL